MVRAKGTLVHSETSFSTAFVSAPQAEGATRSAQLHFKGRKIEMKTRNRTEFFISFAVFVFFAISGLQTERALAATFTVTKTADTNDGVCNSDCSLREAISAANASPGADTITLPAGTYQLTIANAGGTNEDANATGDLDVLDSLTIQGAGSGSTIIEAGTNTLNGIDKVFGLNPICTSPINVTIDGVTVRFGRNTQPSGAADFSFTGGGIDWCSAGSGGTFTLSNSVVSDNTNVNGYGGGLNIDTVSSPTTVNITNVTFQNNQTLNTTQTANGGAINMFGDSPTINITNSTFTGNQTTNPTSGGGAIYFRPTTVGTLSISGSTFSNNTAAGIGGAIATDAHGAATTISIQNSTFTGNHATNAFGGALDLDATNVNTTPFSLSHLTITGNTAGQAGGGLFVGNSKVTMSQSLIVGNSAPTAGGIRKSVDATAVDVSNNWWGCSTGPSAAPCDTASTAGGTLTFTPWYRDQLTATTSPIVTNQSTALTASFLTNSANSAVSTADLAQIIGRSVSWSATNGNVTGAQATIQSAGTATSSFQSTSTGTAVISAKVDNDNTAAVSSNVLNLNVNQASTTAAITNGAALSSSPSVTGQPVAVNFTVTGAYGNSPTAPTGTVTISAGLDSCIAIGSVATGQCSLTFTSAGAKSLTATYAGDSNFNGSTSSTVAHQVNPADTTTTITLDSPDPSVVGQSVTVQFSVAPVSPGEGTATGNVTVSDGTVSCTGTVAAGQCSLTFTSAGAKSLTATYAGNSNFNGSTSATAAHQVNKADTTTTITSDTPDPSNSAQAVTVQYSVAVNSPGAGTPAGNVTVSDGVDSCTGTIAAGTCSITLTTNGARTLTATFAGDSNFNGSTSAGEPHTVNGIATTTSITSDTPDPSVVGQAVTVQYSVTSGSGTPTGNVTVSDGTVSCTGTVAAGQCSLTFTSAGAKSLTATYAGDGSFSGSTSAAEAHQVNKADTTSIITSDTPDPSVVGQTVAVHFSLAPAPPGAGIVTGNITVSDGTVSCTGTVAAGQCSLTFTSAGAKSLTATYSGDSNFNGSTSATVAHQVNKADTATTITSDSPDPSIPGQSVTVQYSVAVNTPGAGTPTGNVTVSDGTVSCTGTVAAGQCSLTFTSAGAKSLTATYAGDSNFNGSTSAGDPHTVNGLATTTSITSDSPDPSVVGQPVTVQYVISSGSGSPAGNVTVSDGTTSCTGTVASGQCSLVFTSAGARSLTASYAGDSTFNGSSSAAEPHQVNKADTTITIISDNPDPSDPGQAVIVNFNVAPNSPGAGMPTGNVTVSDGVNSCTGTTAAGTCSITLMTAGARVLTATYAGDSNFNGSTSAGVPHTVDASPPDTAILTTPTNPAISTSASFTFTGSDNVTPAASLAFQCRLDGNSFATCSSPASYGGLGLGSHTFQVRAIDGAGNVDPTPASYTWQIVAATTLLYNGDQVASVRSSFQVAANLSSSVPACVRGKSVSFYLNALPPAAGSYLLGTASTNFNGQATRNVSTSGLTEGIYDIFAAFSGTATCGASSDQTTLIVANPGDSANGSGWYTLSGSGQINFGFTVRKKNAACRTNCSYTGQLLLINNSRWRLKGALSDYVKFSNGQNVAEGIGDLYWWNSTLNGGRGDWRLAQSGVSFTIDFYDSDKKSSTDKFGINIQYVPVSPQPNTLPNSTPQLLKGGNIKVN
jgi:large repetitive protein